MPAWGLGCLDLALVGDGLTDADGAAVEVDVLSRDGKDLASAHTRCKSEAHSRDVAHMVKSTERLALAGDAVLLADGRVGGLDHLRGDVLDGNLPDVLGHIAQPAHALLEHALGRLTCGSASAVPEGNHAVERHDLLGLLERLLLGFDLGVQATVLVAFGDENGRVAP